MNSEETARALSTEQGRVSILRRLLARMRRSSGEPDYPRLKPGEKPVPGRLYLLGPNETFPPYQIAPSLDELPVAEPVTCYLPQHVFEEMQRGFRFARYVYPSVEDWLELHILPEQRAMPLVEVEVRFRRVVE